MNGNRQIRVQARTEIFTFQHACQPVMRAKPHHVVAGHFPQPFAVVAHLRLLAIENFVDLLQISLGVRVDLFLAERRPGLRLSGGVTNHRGKIPDHEDRRMPHVLKMFQLAQHHRVAKMNIRRRRVHAQVHAQRFAGLHGICELLLQFFFRNDFRHTFPQIGELFLNGLEFGFRHTIPSFRVSQTAGNQDFPRSTRRPSIR